MSEMTVKTFFEEKIARKLSDVRGLSSSVNARYEFDISGDGGGIWTVDLTTEPGSVTSGSTGTAHCVIAASSAAFLDIVSGTMNPLMAYAGGKIKIQGDMGPLMKLQKVIG